MKKRGHATKRFFWSGLVIAILLLSGLLKPVQEFWWGVTSGVQSWFWQTGSYVQWWWHTPQLLAERNALQAEKYTWLANQAQVLSLEKDKIILENALKFLATKKFNYLGARIIAKDKFNERLVIVDRGQNNGAEKGQAFINEQGVILGKVVEVGPDRSSVLLLGDPKSQLAVAIQDGSTIGLVEGRLGGGLVMNYLPLAAEIKLNQLVYTSGLEPKIPAGLVVGQITAVRKEVGDLFQEAGIQSPVNAQESSQGWLIQ
ncbi:MAG: rod shape-determining protein MreC [Candidatus Komeilibacteria bacterium]|nr:rod shape-determining protein MreC [Candidatus Komeilibacteria bacterium]